jgi:hypothetical protein
MSYASILELIQDRLMGEDSADYYTEKEITAPAAVIPWENNPTQWDEANYPQPPRPYVAVDFADLPLDARDGQQTGTIEIGIKVVVDNFYQGRDDSADLNAYKDALGYADHIDALLHHYEGIQIVGYEKPLFARNLIVSTIRIRYEYRRSRSRLPWAAPPPPPDPEP